MIVHLQKLSKQTIIFGIGEAASRLAALLLLPIYTRLLKPDDFGKLAIVSTIIIVAGIVLSAGQSSAFFRFYFQTNDLVARRRLVGTELIFLLSASLVLVGVMEILLHYFGEVLLRNSEILFLVKIGLVTAYFDIGSIIPFALLRAEQRAITYALLSIGRLCFNLTLNIVAVVFLGLGLPGVVFANLLSSALFFGVCSGFTLRYIQWAFDLNLLKGLLNFGLPIVPANLAGWMLNFSDRFFLERFVDLQQVGVYSVGYSLAGIIGMITGWFNTAYSPYVFSISTQPDARLIYARLMTYAISGFVLLGLVLTLFADTALFLLVHPDYYPAIKVVPLIVLSYLFFEFNYLLSFGLDLSGKTKYYPVIVGCGAAMNLILNYCLIPVYGVMGAAWATLLSFALLPILDYLFVHKIYPVPYEWGRLFKLAIVTLGIYILSVFAPVEHIWISAGIRVSLIFAWLLGLYCLGFFRENETRMLKLVLLKGSRFLKHLFEMFVNRITTTK